MTAVEWGTSRGTIVAPCGESPALLFPIVPLRAGNASVPAGTEVGTRPGNAVGNGFRPVGNGWGSRWGIADLPGSLLDPAVGNGSTSVDGRRWGTGNGREGRGPASGSISDGLGRVPAGQLATADEPASRVLLAVHVRTGLVSLLVMAASEVHGEVHGAGPTGRGSSRPARVRAREAGSYHPTPACSQPVTIFRGERRSRAGAERVRRPSPGPSPVARRGALRRVGESVPTARGGGPFPTCRRPVVPRLAASVPHGVPHGRGVASRVIPHAFPGAFPGLRR